MRHARALLWPILILVSVPVMIFSIALSHDEPIAPMSAARPTRQALNTSNRPSPYYVVLAWNDLGMHCISPSFKDMAILPPYNNLMAQVVHRGDPPRVITSGVTLTYAVRNGSTQASNFWQFAQPLFGANLAPGIGLTGNGLSGRMVARGDHFEATGIPVLPVNDQGVWNAYQTAIITLRARTWHQTVPIVLPVSDELHCDKCHADNGDAGPDIATGAVETNILTIHDHNTGTNLMAQRPVLCASCHASNALGTRGQPGRNSLSLAIHDWHSSLEDMPGCYDCHPGPKTQCLRTAIVGMSEVEGQGREPACHQCHGDLKTFAIELAAGREPWVEEPTCEQCHGHHYDTGTTLYRNATGHGGLRCAACHNSPHAWYPSRLTVDNLQPLQHQRTLFSIGSNCTLCHTKRQIGRNPHQVGH